MQHFTNVVLLVGIRPHGYVCVDKKQILINSVLRLKSTLSTTLTTDPYLSASAAADTRRTVKWVPVATMRSKRVLPRP